MKISGIYQIKNLKNDKIYIGSSACIKGRWRDHKCELKHNKHDNPHLQNVVNKYGIENFEFKVLEEVEDKTKLVEREQYWMDKFESYNPEKGYNIHAKANCSDISLEKRKQISRKLKGRKPWNVGLVFSAEQKSKMEWNTFFKDNPLRKGIKAWNKGVKTGPESLETRAKKRQTHLGVKRGPFTAQHRKNLSLSKLLKKNSLEMIQVEKRICKCGCQQTFECQKRSSQLFIKYHHNQLLIPWNKNLTKETDERLFKKSQKMRGKKLGSYKKKVI